MGRGTQVRGALGTASSSVRGHVRVASPRGSGARPVASRNRAAPDARILLVTKDEVLLDDVLRLAAAAGAEVDVLRDPGAARSSWPLAPMIVLGVDAGPAVVDMRLARRDGVVLLGADQADHEVYALGVRLGATDVWFLPRDEGLVMARLADCAEWRGAHGLVLATVGGRGGGGSSTLAAALTMVATRRGRSTLLVDGDPLGGGIDLLVGGEDVVGMRWPDLSAARGRLSGTALTDGLPRLGHLSVLSRDRADLRPVPPEAMQAVIAAGQRSCDLVVVDLPRAIDDAGREALAATSVVLVVVPAEVRATAAAAQVCAAVCAIATDVRLVVRGPAPSGLTGEAVAEALGLPLAGFVKAEPGIATALERGEPPGRRSRGPLARLCGGLLDDILGAAAA